MTEHWLAVIYDGYLWEAARHLAAFSVKLKHSLAMAAFSVRRRAWLLLCPGPRKPISYMQLSSHHHQRNPVPAMSCPLVIGTAPSPQTN